MRLRLLLPILATFFAASVSAATISGTVIPATGIVVAAYDAGGTFVAQTTTNGNGQYALTVSPGSYHLLAYDPSGVYATSFYPDAESFETSSLLDVSGDVTSINFALTKAGYIAGTITSPASAPLANITVAAYNLNGTRRGFTQTDSSGHYFLGVPPGTYIVGAFDNTLQYVTTFFNNQETFGNANPVTVVEAATATANFVLAQSVHITGTVSGAGGAALGNIVVNAYAPSGTVSGTSTDDAGHYDLALRSGPYRMVFFDPNSDYAPVYYPNAESFSTSSLVSAPATNISVQMAHGGHISGTVTSSGGGAPSNVIVAAYNADGTVRASTFATSGQYSLLVPPGDYRIGAFDNSLAYAPQFFSQQVLFGGATVVHAVAGATASGVAFSLHAGGRISGAVTDRGTGEPVSGITVAAYDTAGTSYGSTQSKVDGSYRFVVEPGTYKLVASDDSQHYATAFLGNAVNFDADPAVSVGASQEITGENLAMPLAAHVAGSVTAANGGAAIAGIVIDAYDANGFLIASTTTSPAGGFALPLPGGTYKFVASDPQHRYATSFYLSASTYDTATAVALTGGQSMQLSFQLSVLTAPLGSRRRAVRH